MPLGSLSLKWQWKYYLLWQWPCNGNKTKVRPFQRQWWFIASPKAVFIANFGNEWMSVCELFLSYWLFSHCHIVALNVHCQSAGIDGSLPKCRQWRFTANMSAVTVHCQTVGYDRSMPKGRQYCNAKMRQTMKKRINFKLLSEHCHWAGNENCRWVGNDRFIAAGEVLFLSYCHYAVHCQKGASLPTQWQWGRFHCQ